MIIWIIGIMDVDLVDKFLFEDLSIVDVFLEFVGDVIIVVYNVKFDCGFLNMEL